MAFSPLSIGIELQPAGVDRRWVRIWVLDRSAQPSARSRLVVLIAATAVLVAVEPPAVDEPMLMDSATWTVESSRD